MNRWSCISIPPIRLHCVDKEKGISSFSSFNYSSSFSSAALLPILWPWPSLYWWSETIELLRDENMITSTNIQLAQTKFVSLSGTSLKTCPARVRRYQPAVRLLLAGSIVFRSILNDTFRGVFNSQGN